MPLQAWEPTRDASRDSQVVGDEETREASSSDAVVDSNDIGQSPGESMTSSLEQEMERISDSLQVLEVPLPAPEKPQQLPCLPSKAAAATEVDSGARKPEEHVPPHDSSLRKMHAHEDWGSNRGCIIFIHGF